MQWLSFLKNLMPSTSKSDIVNLIYNIKKEAKDINLDVMEKAVSVLGNYSDKDFTSKEVKSLLVLYYTYVKQRKGNIITTVARANENALAMLEMVLPVVESNFKESTLVDSITFRKGQYIQFIDAVLFYTRFTRIFMNYLVVHELAKYDQGNAIKERITPKEIEKFEAGKKAFFKLTNVFSMKIQDVMRLLAKVPDYKINADTLDVDIATLGREIDPLELANGFISVTYNPWYTYQAYRAVKAHQEYEHAKAEREFLMLQLMDLEAAAQGSPDTKVQEKIEVIRSQLNILTKKIDEEEQEYGK